MITTNFAADLFSEDSSLPSLSGKWTSRGVISKTGTVAWDHEGGTSVYLIAAKGGHGGHLNVFFGEMK